MKFNGVRTGGVVEAPERHPGSSGYGGGLWTYQTVRSDRWPDGRRIWFREGLDTQSVHPDDLCMTY